MSTRGGDFPAPPPRPECPICVLTLPLPRKESIYKECCGKIICKGCAYESMRRTGEAYSCAFCRGPPHENDDEYIARLKKRVAKYKDAEAMYNLSVAHRDDDGVPQDPRKELDLLRQAADMGHPHALHNLSCAYREGRPDAGIEVSWPKHKEYLELAAYRSGDDRAWYNLGVLYMMEGNIQAGSYHYRMAAAYGDDDALDAVKRGYMNGSVKKEDFAETLRAWKNAQDDMRSEGRQMAQQCHWFS